MQYVRLRLQQSVGLRTRLMFHITTANKAGREVITPAGIASGAGDTYFLNLNRELGAANQISYVRPMGEMNQAANVYSAYGHGGYRGKSHSQANFKRAWRRLTLILRGGNVAAINARLRASGMPPVRTSASSLPTPPVALMWCPQVSGNPGVAGNAARAYYPGSAYVDWICTDFYSGYPNFSGLNRFYSEFARTGKPFAFGEWGIYPGGDAPGFVRSLFRFVKSHPGVRMVLFNQGNHPGGRFRLQRYPRSAAALRSQAARPKVRRAAVTLGAGRPATLVSSLAWAPAPGSMRAWSSPARGGGGFPRWFSSSWRSGWLCACCGSRSTQWTPSRTSGCTTKTRPRWPSMARTAPAPAFRMPTGLRAGRLS